MGQTDPSSIHDPNPNEISQRLGIWKNIQRHLVLCSFFLPYLNIEILIEDVYHA